MKLHDADDALIFFDLNNSRQGKAKLRKRVAAPPPEAWHVKTPPCSNMLHQGLHHAPRCATTFASQVTFDAVDDVQPRSLEMLSGSERSETRDVERCQLCCFELLKFAERMSLMSCLCMLTVCNVLLICV